VVARPYDLTEALAVTEALARSEALAALVLDVSEAFLDGGGAGGGGEAARQVGAMLARLTAPLARSGLALLVIHDGMARAGDPPMSHWRPYGTDDGRASHGTPLAHHAGAAYAMSGGTPLAHHAAVRLGLRREEWLRRPGSDTLPGGGDVYGYWAQVEVLKSRLGTSGRSATIEIIFE
jgi:RecA/RadA recombinase